MKNWEKEELGNILFDVVSDTSKCHEQCVLAKLFLDTFNKN
jgi:hypothetical protein